MNSLAMEKYLAEMSLILYQLMDMMDDREIVGDILSFQQPFETLEHPLRLTLVRQLNPNVDFFREEREFNE